MDTGAKEAVVQEKEIAKELGILANKLNELDNEVVKLLDAISPLLVEAGKVTGEDSSELKALCPLANEIREYRWKVENIANVVEDINNRIQI